MDPNATRYEIELDMLERRPELSDRDAVALLRREFQMAVNASHFSALSADDPRIVDVARTVPQEGVARYAMTLEFAERRSLGAEQATALIHSEFVRAFNASYFLRISLDDLPTVAVARERVADEASLRWAA